MAEVKNLSRLMGPYFDRDPGMAEEEAVFVTESTWFVLSPDSQSFVGGQYPWNSAVMASDDGYAQLRGISGNGDSSFDALPGDASDSWKETSPAIERDGSFSHSAAEETDEPKKRHRRVYGPVKGNNKSGKRGKLSCTQCRKIRSKCVYKSPEETCERCTERGYECIKTWGPKKTLSYSNKSPSGTELVLLNSPSGSSSPESMPLVASSLSLLFDANLPDSELNLIRFLHDHHRGAKTTSCVGVLLQNLWESYGNIPTDKALLYASLMWESYWKDYGSAADWSPTGTWEFFNYKDKFISEMRTALKDPENINECHFFALFLASQSTKSGVRGFQDELNTYQQGMVRILRILLSQPGKNNYRPLMKLYKFIVSFSRRIMCRGDFSMPEYLVEDAAKLIPEDPQDSMQVILHPTERTSVGQTISNIPVPKKILVPLHEEGFEHDWDRWNDTVCCLCKEFATMAECFHIFLISGETCRLTTHAIRATREKLDRLVSINDISYVFRTMNDAFVPLNVRQGHPHERGLINFLISLFRASGLLIILEFLLDGQVPRHRRRVFEEVRRAEELVQQYDPLVWSLRKTELVSSMGLILAPFLYEEDLEELEERREWLTEVWKEHYRDETERYARCEKCPCRSLGRVQRLWRTEMGRRDYISFLSENAWVWCQEPGWAMEPKLREQPDSFEVEKHVSCTVCG